ncbi:MAG: L,D-transpeptidase [Elusimicrobiota bacterium]
MTLLSLFLTAAFAAAPDIPAAGPIDVLDIQLSQAGYTVAGRGDVYEVPYVEIRMPVGFTITSFCRKLPMMRDRFELCRSRLSSFNMIEPNYEKTATSSEPWAILADKLKIPLDLEKEPRVFPESDPAVAGHAQFILIDIAKGYLGLYERGTLVRTFPVSAGAGGHQTPRVAFTVDKKDANHYSSIYGSWMPWAIHVSGAYWMHGGVLPGVADSHGCIRMMIPDAKELFGLVNVGARGRIR